MVVFFTVLAGGFVVECKQQQIIVIVWFGVVCVLLLKLKAATNLSHLAMTLVLRLGLCITATFVNHLSCF